MDTGVLSQQISALDSSYNPTQQYNDSLNKLGIADARTSVQSLSKAILDNTNLVNNVDSSVTGRTSGSLVTEAQRQRLVGAEKAPLVQAGSTLAGNLTTAQTRQSDIERQAQMESNLAGDTYKAKRQSLSDQLTQAQNDKQQAEQQRQFNLTLQANKAKASSSSATKKSSVDEVLNYFKSADSQYGAYNANGTNYHRWEAAEKALIDEGYDPNKYKKQLAAAFGSNADKIKYGVAGYSRY